jgi:hypothetical protein
MKIKVLILLTVITFLVFLGACTRASTGDPQATIDAAVKATSDAQQAVQATIEAAVKSTAQAQTTQQPAATSMQATPALQSQPTAQPTPDYASMSEEELAALIDEAVNQAMTDYAAASTAVTQATSDGTVTNEEAAATTTSVSYVNYEIAHAEELIKTYYDYYGVYPEETLDTLNTIEQDLAAILSILDEILAITEQGATAATAAIDQLNAALTQAQEKSSEVQTKIQGFQDKIKTALDQRENEVLNLPPTDIATTQIGAINQAHDFLETFKNVLGDGKLAPDELYTIGQLAANARASLEKTGDPKLQEFGKTIEALTRYAVRGEWGQARNGLGDFEHSLPARRR